MINVTNFYKSGSVIFQQWDENQDNILTQNEFNSRLALQNKKNYYVYPEFNEFDSDKNGQINRKEFDNFFDLKFVHKDDLKALETKDVVFRINSLYKSVFNYFASKPNCDGCERIEEIAQLNGDVAGYVAGLLIVSPILLMLSVVTFLKFINILLLSPMVLLALVVEVVLLYKTIKSASTLRRLQANKRN